MENTSRKPEAAASVEGAKFLPRLAGMLERLRPAQCQRDRARNRRLFFDHLCGLLLLTFFNPSLKTLRDLQRASRLAAVRRKLGCSEASLGSLSEAMHLFDPNLLAEIVKELLDKLPQSPTADPRLKALAYVPTAVDGTFLLRLPQITQACFASRKDRGWKLHAHFEVLRGVPTFGRVTDASGQGPASEKAVLKASLAADHCYVVDRGYEEFALFNAIVAATAATSAESAMTTIFSRRQSARFPRRPPPMVFWKMPWAAWARRSPSGSSTPTIPSAASWFV